MAHLALGDRPSALAATREGIERGHGAGSPYREARALRSLAQALGYLGTANITRIIRWRDMAHRDEVWPRLQANPARTGILARVPGGMASYLRLEAKFAEALM